jgi:hypothetical protein
LDIHHVRVSGCSASVVDLERKYFYSGVDAGISYLRVKKSEQELEKKENTMKRDQDTMNFKSTYPLVVQYPEKQKRLSAAIVPFWSFRFAATVEPVFKKINKKKI